MTIESDLTRIAKALESIAGTLHVLAHPPMMYTPPADVLEQLGTQPGIMVPVPRAAAAVDASQAYISGTWKRRAGDNIQPTGRMSPQPHGAPAAPLDPWVRVDVPNVEPARGQLGLKEETDGKATDSTAS